MPERMVQANGVELCTESFGDPADPSILRRRHPKAKQPALEPAILGPCQMLDDARNRQIRHREKADRSLFPREFDERSRSDRSVGRTR